MARIELSNIGGGGTTLSLTTTGTSGASTLAGSVLNIPVYQGALTLTTTGTSGAATLSGTTLNIPQYSGGGGTPAGSAGQVQFNSTPAGSFAASANLAWDNSSAKLNIGAPSLVSGVLNVKSGSSLATTIHSQFTNSANADVMNLFNGGRVIFGATTFNDPSSVITGFGSRISVANASNYQDFQFVNTSISSGNINSYSFGQRRDVYFGNQLGSFQIVGYYADNNGSVSPVGGTYRVPLICNPDGTVIISGAANSTNGNVSVGTTSSIANFGIRGSNTSGGTNALLVQNNRSPTPDDIHKIENNGKISYLATNTAAGTTGAQTINRPSGTVNFLNGTSALVVTNSLCTTSSIVFATVRTNDATAYIKNVVPAAGSFTINLGANATAETSVGFFIIN